MPCPSRSLCQDPANPFANLSMEREDVLDFIGLVFDPGVLPPLGSNFAHPTCLSACVSTVSQQDADLCAARDELACASSDWCVTNCDGGTIPTGPTSFRLTAIGCLSTVTVNVPFGLSPDQLQLFIDDMVNEVLRQQSICNGLTPPGPPSPTSYTLSAQGCMSLITVTVPFNSTMDQVLGFVNAMLAQISAQQAQCAPPKGPDSIQPPPGFPAVLFYNSALTITALCPDGLPFSITVPAGTFSALSQDWVNQIAASFGQKWALAEMFCLSSLSPVACENSAFMETIVVSGGTEDSYTFTLEAGSLPDGLTLTPTGGRTLQVSGTPIFTGLFSFTILAVDAAGNFMAKDYDMAIVGIIDQTLPVFTQNTPYSHQLAAVLSAAPGEWNVTAGTLPDGVTLSITGLLSGTPTGVTSGTFTITVTDANGFPCSQDFTPLPSHALDWTELVWGAPTYSNPGGVIIPENCSANNIDCGYFTNGTLDIVATLQYADGGHNSNLNHLMGNDPFFGFNVGEHALIIVTVDAVPVLNLLITVNEWPGGFVDTPFTMPATSSLANVVVTIHFDMGPVTTVFSGLGGTFTNLP